jgi:hypothetical protein
VLFKNLTVALFIEKNTLAIACSVAGKNSDPDHQKAAVLSIILP